VTLAPVRTPGGEASTCSLTHTSLSEAQAVRKSTRVRPVKRRSAPRTRDMPFRKLPRVGMLPTNSVGTDMTA
jgi:hypothetical protein